MNLPATCVKRPIATTMLTLISVLIGGFALWRLPIDLLPEVTLPTLTIRSTYGNASPEEMERIITEKIEETVALVSGVEEITSESGEGSSNVRMRFAYGTDLDAAANEVRDRIDRVSDELPDDFPRPRVSKYDISNSPIVILGVSSSLDPVELTSLIENEILYRFEQIEGVAVMDMWGESDREIRVELDLERIRALNLPLETVLGALRAANINLPAGEIDRGRQEVTIRTPGEFESLEELKSTVVAVRERGPIQLDDIAVIVDSHREKTRIVRIEGKPGVRLAARKEQDANTAEVSRKVLAVADQLEREFPQLSINVARDHGQYIERAIANVGRSVFFGGGLAVLVLLIFLRNLRSTTVIATAIPISVLSTFALIEFGGFTLNLMTLGGLALGIGMMVDNSIVVLENIFRREVEEKEPPDVASVRGAGEVASAVIASTATTLVIFLPLAFVDGVSGVLFRQLAMVVAFALAVSLVVSLTVVPMMSAKLLPPPEVAAGAAPKRGLSWLIDRVGGGILGAIERFYLGVLRDSMRFRLATIGLAGAMLGGAFAVVPLVGSDFLPPSDEGEVRVSGEMEVGTRLELVDRQTKLMESLVLGGIPELKSATVTVGASSWNPDDASEGEISMSLVPVAERTRSNTEIADELRSKLDGRIPGMEIRTRAPQGQRMLERVLGSSDGLEVEIRGFDLEVLDALASEAETAIKEVEGVTDVRAQRRVGVPQELIRVDRRKAADLGVSVERVARTLETALGGTQAGSFREDGDEHRIFVRLRDARKLPLDQILDITLIGNNGREVALRNLVSVEPGTGPLIINRKDQQRIATIGINYTGRDAGAVASDVQDQLDRIVTRPGYNMAVAGTYEEQKKTTREMGLTFALAVVLVYMVLASQYESLRDPLVVMLSVPAAAIGVVATLYLSGTTFNLQSYIGCIMLGGIVVNNAILLVDQAGRLRRAGHATRDALREAGRRRLRPILMTSLTTILGLMPLALGLGEGAEAQAPLARAVVGGLAFSTLVSLLLVPAVYSLIHAKDDRSPAAA